ncbi:MAG: isochorismatase family protein [Gammaproteobacteria bacterium]
MNTLADASECLLIVVDVQQHIAESIPNKVIKRVVKNTNLLMRAAGILNIPIILTERNPNTLGSTERSILSLIEPKNIFSKTNFSAYKDKVIVDAIDASERSQIILAGTEAHVSILQTAIDLVRKGYTVFVVEDSICSRTLESYQNALLRLSNSDVIMTCAESVLFEWANDLTSPSYLKVQSLLN